MGKKIKNVIKKATNPVSLIKPDAPNIPDAPEVAPVAQPIETPKVDQGTAETDATTEAGRKKARSGGKKALSVSRSSGGGLNL